MGRQHKAHDAKIPPHHMMNYRVKRRCIGELWHKGLMYYFILMIFLLYFGMELRKFKLKRLCFILINKLLCGIQLYFFAHILDINIFIFI